MKVVFACLSAVDLVDRKYCFEKAREAASFIDEKSYYLHLISTYVHSGSRENKQHSLSVRPRYF